MTVCGTIMCPEVPDKYGSDGLRHNGNCHQCGKHTVEFVLVEVPEANSYKFCSVECIVKFYD